VNALPVLERAGTVAFRELLAGDVLRIFVQPAQHLCLGVNRPVLTLEDAMEMVSGGPAWTAFDEAGRILTVAGFKELWPPNPPKTDGHAIAWAVLAADLGPAHLPITMFAREQIAAAPYSRLEAIVRMNVPTEFRWARLCGFGNPRVMRKWGPDGEAHMLLERIR
jgi:hypothetical protein